MILKKSVLVVVLFSFYFLTIVGSQNPKFLEKEDKIFSLLTSDKISELRVFLESNSNSVNVKNLSGETALFQAIKNNNIKAVDALLMDGAFVNIKNLEGMTPLIYAVIYAKNSKIIESLIELGNADVNLPDNTGKTALHYAVEHKKDFAILKLLKNKANIDAQDLAGETPLMDALSKPNNFKIVNLLMKNQPNLNLVNNWNETLFHFAVKNQGYEELVQYLLAVGLNPFEYNTDGEMPKFEKSYEVILKNWQKKLDEFQEFQELSNFLNKIPTNKKSIMAIGKNTPEVWISKPIAQKTISKKVIFS